MKRILITGGTGFIGTHLAKRLLELNYKIVCLNSTKTINTLKGVNIINKDLIKHDPNEGLSKNFDIIIHLAGKLVITDFINNPELPFFNNIYTTLNLLEDIKINNPRAVFIFTSSEKVYGKVNKKFVSEELSGFPLDAYGSSKLICELLIKNYNINHGIKYVIFRPANCFGPGQRPGLFIPSFISKIVNGDKLISIGNVNFYRNFVYVSDLVNAIIRSIENPKAFNKTFNISSYNLKIEEVLNKILEVTRLLGRQEIKIVKDKKLFRPLRYESDRYTLECKKASNILDWKPTYTFEDAIKETLKDYFKHMKY